MATVGAGEGAERFQRDGAAYADVLDRLLRIFQHCRAMHRELANRDFAIVKLQSVVRGLCADRRDTSGQLARVVGVRNGLLAAYLELRSAHEQLRVENSEIRGRAASAASAALDSAALSGNAELAAGLKGEAGDFVVGVRADTETVRSEIDKFRGDLAAAADALEGAVLGYAAVVRSRAQVAVQTDRVRRTFEFGVQAGTSEEPKGRRK